MGRIQLTKKDYVIICGDFGLLWNYKSLGRCIGSNTNDWCWAEDEIKLLEWYNSCPWTTLVVLGNHENYDRWETYPITEWHGGRVQRVGSSIIRLMNGEIYEIDGRSIFCMGGAMSTDRGYATGTEKYDIHKWWWPQEIPSAEEWNHSFDNLEKVNWKVDYIITHDAPAAITYRTNKSWRISEVSNRLEQIYTMTEFKRWFCGHLHRDEDYYNCSILYHRVVPIEYKGEDTD
jgi:hypothetical protein